MTVYQTQKMVMFDTMNSKQLMWCKEKEIICNIIPQVAKQLNMCTHYALIPEELFNEFTQLR